MTQYHWILTLEVPGAFSGTYSGLVDVPEGATRKDVFEQVFESIRSEFPRSQNTPSTVFWSLEPNQL